MPDKQARLPRLMACFLADYRLGRPVSMAKGQAASSQPAMESSPSSKARGSMEQSLNEEVARFLSMEQSYFEEVARFARSPAFSVQGELVSSHRPVPPPIMHQVLQLARNSRSDTTQRGRLLRRAATASTLAFAFKLRGDSLVQLRRQDVTVSADGLDIRTRVVKTRSRTVATTVRRPGRDEVYDVISSWLADFRASPAAPLWTIDGASPASLSSTCLVASFRVLRDELSRQFMVTPRIGGDSSLSDLSEAPERTSALTSAV